MTTTEQTTAGPAGRYARALFELAQESDALDRVNDDLLRLQALMDDNADLRTIIRSPIASREDQGRAMDALAKKIALTPLSQNFLGLLAAKRRLFDLRRMIGAYGALLSAHRGEVSAEVTSAKKLTQKQWQSLVDALKKCTGSDVVIKTKIDPDLLGGLVVKLGSRMVDSSLRTKLERLRLTMKGVA